MASINHLGNITARCQGCSGSMSTFEWSVGGKEVGFVRLPRTVRMKYGGSGDIDHRLYRCAGCGRGGMALVAFSEGRFPSPNMELRDFYRETSETLKLPEATPEGIVAEFREAEVCMGANAHRAAAGLFRSVLDKVLRANGYKLKPGTNLEQQIELAGADGVITAARVKRAHEEVRVLGNDVLHDEWRVIPPVDVEAAHHYAQRIIEDFYDERDSVVKVLREKGRVPDEDRKAEESVAAPVATAPTTRLRTR